MDQQQYRKITRANSILKKCVHRMLERYQLVRLQTNFHGGVAEIEIEDDRNPYEIQEWFLSSAADFGLKYIGTEHRTGKRVRRRKRQKVRLRALRFCLLDEMKEADETIQEVDGILNPSD